MGQDGIQHITMCLHVTLVRPVSLIWIELPRLNHLFYWIRSIVGYVLQKEGPKLTRALAEQVLQPEQLVRGHISRGLLLHSLPEQLLTASGSQPAVASRFCGAVLCHQTQHPSSCQSLPPCNAFNHFLLPRCNDATESLCSTLSSCLDILCPLSTRPA